MAEIIRLDPFQNITSVHWREPNTETDPATDPVTDPPLTEPVTDPEYPYKAIFQAVTGSNTSSMCPLYSAQVVTFGLINGVPVCSPSVDGGSIQVGIVEPSGWPGSSLFVAGFYLIKSTSPIMWPTLDPLAFDPIGSTGYDRQRQIIGQGSIEAVDPGYRYYIPDVGELPPEYEADFGDWVPPP